MAFPPQLSSQMKKLRNHNLWSKGNDLKQSAEWRKLSFRDMAKIKVDTRVKLADLSKVHPNSGVSHMAVLVY